MSMVCTKCHQETPGNIDGAYLKKLWKTRLGRQTIIDLCNNWRCNECNEEDKREQATMKESNAALTGEQTEKL